MNRFLLSLILLFSTLITFSQQRNLNFYLDQAQKNSPLINKNKNDTKIVKLDLQQTERILKSPVISLESGILFAPIISYDAVPSTFDVVSSGSSNYTGFDLGITNGGQYQAYLSIKQALLGKMNLKPYTQKADISRKQNENSTTLTVHELEQLVGYQYILCLKSKAQIKNGKTILQLLDEQLSIMHKLVDNAVYKQSDLMLLEIEKQNKILENKSFEDDYKANLYNLNLLCGIKESTEIDIQETELTMKSDAATSSQFLISYKLDSLGIVADQTISELKYKPQLNAFANAGYNATGIPTLDHFGFSVGMNFSWTLYDGNQRKLEREKSSVNLQIQQFEKEYFITQKEINLNKIKAQLKALTERGIILESQLAQYEKLYKVYENELAHGLVSVMDYKNLLKDLTAKRQEYLMQKMEKQLLLNSYNYWNY
ncbi:MAG: TolC family protein [Paludibacter sp.]